MTRPLWVIGAGGLVGSHLVARAAAHGFDPVDVPAIPWSDRRAATDLLRATARRVSSMPDWSVAWCAGVGVVGTPAAELAVEIEHLSAVLDGLAPGRGRVLLVSSAGGVYAGSDARPVDESTPPSPISDYGRAKLDQEDRVRRWADARGDIALLIARISNVYGIGQSLEKPQGLPSHLVRSVLRGRPARVYVPLDTMRDYIWAEDAGERLARALARLAAEPVGTVVTKIIASSTPITVGAITGTVRRLARRRGGITTAIDGRTSLQPRRLVFRSTVWREIDSGPATDFATGLARVLREQLALLQAGRLP